MKLVVAAIFAKYLILEFRRILKMLEFVEIGLNFRICLNTLGFSICLNVPEYARVMNIFQQNAWKCLKQDVKDSLEKKDTEVYSELLQTSSIERYAKINIVVNYFCKTFWEVWKGVEYPRVLNMPGLHKVMNLPYYDLDYWLYIFEYAWNRTLKIALKSLYKLPRTYWWRGDFWNWNSFLICFIFKSFQRSTIFYFSYL